MRLKKILLADDHPVFLFGLKSIIDNEKGMKVAHMLSNGKEALAKIKSSKPDIAILDVDMPGVNGIEIARRVKNTRLKTKIIILTMYKDEAIFNLAFDSGAVGYVLKDNASTDLLQGINIISAGGFFISPPIHSYYANRIDGNPTSIISNIKTLSHAEIKVLKLIAENKSSSEIAKELFLSVKTVQNHRFNICKKMELEGVNSLLAFSLQNKHLINLCLI